MLSTSLFPRRISTAISFAMLCHGAAAVITSFEEPSLPAAVVLDVPNTSLGNVVFDDVNDELDFTAAGNTDMWGTRNNAAIAWTDIPAGLSIGSAWTVETEVRLNSVVQNGQVAGITFYGGPDGARPDISFGLDNWDPAGRAVRLQGLGDNDPNVGILTSASKVFLRVMVTEGGVSDTFNFFFKVNPGDAWTQLGGAALNYTTSFASSRIGLIYKTSGAKDGAAFTYFNVADAGSLPPQIIAHPSNLSAVLGGVARFTVTATGALSYQWRRGGVNVSEGGTSSTYVIDPTMAGDNAANFDCVVTNANGSATSNPATLTLVNPPVGAGYYASAVQTEPSLLAYFPVDGSGSPNVVNVKNGIYSGTLGGGAVHDSVSTRTAGRKSLAIGGNGWVGLTKDAAWDFSDGNGTIEMFVYQTAAAAYNPSVFAVRNDGGGGTRYSIHADSAGAKFWFFNGSSAPTWTLPTNGIGRLMHLMFVINNGQCTMYHNGTSLGVVTQALGGVMNLPSEIGSAGPSAQESFPGNIDEVALYADPLPASAALAHYRAWVASTVGVPPIITTQPVNKTVNEGGATSFSVAISNATQAAYRWQKNGVDIPNATISTYTISGVSMSDNGAQFRCIIYNSFGGSVSNSVTLTVKDVTAPLLLNAIAPLASTKIFLTFNEPINLATASFSVAGGAVTSFAAGPLPGMVTLTVTGLNAGQAYTVTATNVKDLTGNNRATSNTGFTAAPAPIPAPIAQIRPEAEPAGPATRRGPLVFSEIHYHPAERADLANLEFIEIYNSQTWAEDLKGYRISGEVNYEFPAGTEIAAGGRLVVAADPEAMMSVFGISGVLGPWGGSLNNSGGQVRLKDISNGVIFEVHYDAGYPWPVAADGSGHSLVLARGSYGMKDPRAWDFSRDPGGSPGAAEPAVADPYRTVMINEISSNTAPSDDFIELYNYSPAAVDLSDCSLSDDRDAAKYLIPAGTMIAAGARLALTQTQLGFGMKAGGDTVYFRAPGSGAVPGRLLDAVRFGSQRPGTSFGRFPDGAAEFSVLDGASPGLSNHALAPREAVISEVLFHAPAGSTQPPFVEITNTSGAALVLDGWRLRGGISYLVPPGTTLAPGARLVVNSFSGKLNQGTGERLRLEKPILNIEGGLTETIYPTIDEVTYGTGGRWGRWTDGGGSSLEMKDLRSDGRRAGNWGASDETPESGWVTIEQTGVLDNGSGAPINRLHVMMLGEGECLVDEIEVIPDGGSNLLINGGFENGTAGWLLQGTHDASSLEAGGFMGASALHVRAAARGDLAGNRISGTLSVPLDPGSTATIRARVKWLRGTPEILLRLNGGVLEATGNILANTVIPGSPGTVNSRQAGNAGPAIRNVGHFPVLPQAGQPVTVYANIADPDGLLLVLLRYRLDPSSTLTNVAMSYRGAGIYSADIPAQVAGTLAAFHIQAYDGSSVASTFPEDAPIHECLARWGEPIPAGTLGAYHLWMTQATINTWTTRLKNSNTPLDITFVYGNSRVIYNASALYSGSPFHTPGFNGPTGNPCDYDCSVPADDLFLGEKDFILAGPGTFGDDTSFIREQTMWWTARKIGLQSIHRRFCRVFVNGTQRQTVFEDTQQPGGEWIDEYWPDDNDGNLHKAQDWIEFGDDASGFKTDNRALFTKLTTTGGVHKIAAYRYQWSTRSVENSANDWEPFTQLVDAHNSGTSATDPAYFAALDPLVDQPSWARALAIQRIGGNWDTWGWYYGKNMYIYKPTRGPWAMTAWDIDFSLDLVGFPATAGLFDNSQDPLAEKFRSQPDFRRAYWCAFREAVDGPMLATNAEARIDAMVAGLAANGIISDAGQVAVVKNYIANRRSYILSQLDAVYSATTLGLLGSDTLTDDDGMLTLTGTAPVGVKSLRINGVTYHPLWTSETEWSLPITLYAQNNLLTIEALDRSENVIGSFPVKVTTTAPPPVPAIAINEWMADHTSDGGFPDPADGDFDDWFELYNAGTTAVDLGGFYLTDDVANRTKFRIPNGTLMPAGGYLLVWADNEEVQNGISPGQLHVGFRLAAGGEKIGLYTPDGLEVDLVVFGAQSPNGIEGRYPDGGAEIVSPVPTPGLRNALSPVVLSFQPQSPGNYQFIFSTEPGYSYQIESSLDLQLWEPSGLPIPATEASLSVPVAGGALRRFWRGRLMVP